MSGAAQDQGAQPKAHRDNMEPCSKTAPAPSSTETGTSSSAEGRSTEDQHTRSGGSDRPSSPEPNCAICLGTLENKSFTDSCFHMFCFVCLQEWSKVKAECPLCKQPFKSIIHNVRSYNNYDQFYLEHQHTAPQPPIAFGWNFDRTFRYRTTLTMDHHYYNANNMTLLNTRSLSNDPSMQLYRRSSLPHYRLRSRSLNPHTRQAVEPVSTTDFRRRIYDTGRRVAGLRSTYRRRVVTPDFFRHNPAQTHRLVPWLNRELNSLLYSAENQVTFVLELIMDLIQRFSIDSEEFYEHIHPYLHHNTRHFMHEFLSFARSPYTMSTYDTKAIYEEPSHTVSSSSSSSNDDDVVVVDDDEDEQAVRSVQNTFDAESSDLWRASEMWRPWGSPEIPNILNSSSVSRSGWDSPTPGPSWDLSGNSTQSPVNVDDSDSDASTIIAQDVPSSIPARSSSPADSDGEEVVFVSYEKPWEERSPIQLSSGSDEDTLLVRALKQEHINKKKKKKKKATKTSSTMSHITHRSRSRDRNRSSSPSIFPMGYQRPSNFRSSRHDDHPPSLSRSKQERRHKKKRRHDSTERSRHSSRSSHKEKRHGSSSSGRDRLPLKKRRINADEAKGEDVSLRKHKHKHKKHSKSRHEKHSTRKDGNENGSHRIPAESATSTTAARNSDRCKKHPSGHKKSRVKEAGDGCEAKDNSNGHHSDSLLSDTSNSSSSSITTPTTSFTGVEQSASKSFSRQQRVQQVLRERQRQVDSHSSFPSTSIDIPPSWDNISRLAHFFATRNTGHLSLRPSPRQPSDDPVVISASSDESDLEASGKSHRDGLTSSDSIKVAKTVVVPCNSYLGTPAAAFDLPGASTSSNIGSVGDDEYIDIESISSSGTSEMVDVESLDETEDSSMELISSSETDTKAKLTKTSSVMEISTEEEHAVSPSVTVSPKTPVSINEAQPSPYPFYSVINRDVFMGADLHSQSLSRQTSTASNTDLPLWSQDFTSAHSQLQSLEQLQDVGQESCEKPQSSISKHNDGNQDKTRLSTETESKVSRDTVSNNESRSLNAEFRNGETIQASTSQNIFCDEDALTDTEERMVDAEKESVMVRESSVKSDGVGDKIGQESSDEDLDVVGGRDFDENFASSLNSLSPVLKRQELVRDVIVKCNTEKLREEFDEKSTVTASSPFLNSLFGSSNQSVGPELVTDRMDKSDADDVTKDKLAEENELNVGGDAMLDENSMRTLSSPTLKCSDPTDGKENIGFTNSAQGKHDIIRKQLEKFNVSGVLDDGENQALADQEVSMITPSLKPHTAEQFARSPDSSLLSHTPQQLLVSCDKIDEPMDKEPSLFQNDCEDEFPGHVSTSINNPISANLSESFTRASEPVDSLNSDVKESAELLLKSPVLTQGVNVVVMPSIHSGDSVLSSTDLVTSERIDSVDQEDSSSVFSFRTNQSLRSGTDIERETEEKM